MKKIDNPEIDINLDDFPDNLVKLITELIEDKHYPEKHNARIALVKMGKRIIPQMHRLLDYGNSELRLEAAKVVQLIADRKSIPILIELLGDNETDIRWIAAEGLVKVGRRSILPLLKSVRGSKSNVFLNQGTHHVLNSLLSEKERHKLGPLLHSLENYHQLGGTAPAEAANALKTVFK